MGGTPASCGQPGSDSISVQLGLGGGFFDTTIRFDGDRDVDVEMGVDNGKLMAFLARHGEILSQQYQGVRVTIHCRLPQKYLGRISQDEATVTFHDAAAETEGPADVIEDVA